MDAVAVLSVLVAISIVVTLVFGWRDGWLPLPWRLIRKQYSPVFGATRPFNHVAIAEIANFKAMRRRLGYQTANTILRNLAARISSDDRLELGRVGRTSIEFLYHASDSADALAQVSQLRQVLEHPVIENGVTFDLEVVIGSNRISSEEAHDELFDLSAFAVEDAYRREDRISFAQADTFTRAAAQSASMLTDLAEAIRSDLLELHYLPKLCLSTQEIVSAEALCRWTHPQHGEVSPSEFIALAEETGLIDNLTLRTLDRAIADQRRLLAAGLDLPLDVNLSGRLVSDSSFCDRVLDRINLAAGRIGLEITETASIEAPDVALANLQRFADAGLRISIDDFGSGLASLSYLRDLPAHELKIDQCFVRNLVTSNRDPLLVRSAIEIARALEMEVTAEGVEDELALSLLAVMRCNYVQGFHISQPLPLSGLITFLENWKKEAAGPSPDRQWNVAQGS